MFDKKIAYMVEKYFHDFPHKKLPAKELARILRIKKHHYKNLLDTLNKMKKEKKLVLSGRNFSSAPKPVHDKIVIGKLDATSLAKNNTFAFAIVQGMADDVFISLEDLNGAYHGDTIEISIRFKRGRRHHGSVIRVVERARNSFVGVIRKLRNRVLFLADSGKIHTDFLVSDTKNAQEGEKVVFEIESWNRPKQGKLPIGNVIEILGKSGDPEVEILSVIRFYDLPMDFPEPVLQQAETLSTEVEVTDNRKDLRHLETFTIDPASAKDYDDAISFISTESGWTLYVHIADVAHYVHKDTPLFDEAVKRGNSFYFPKRVIPMLPEKISNKLCSLRPYEEKYAITTVFHLNKNFEILDEEVYESVILSDARLTYEQVDDLFEEKEIDIPESIQNTLLALRKFSHYLTKQRIKNGYLMFSLPDNAYIFDDDGKLLRIDREAETDSHKVIENCMLLANEYISRLLTAEVGSTLYRIHDKPELDRLMNMKRLMKYYGVEFSTEGSLNAIFQSVLYSIPDVSLHRVFDPIVLRLMKKAKYSTDHIAHFGLAIDTYTHFTSPIRRLCDLVIHHQLKKHVIRKRKKTFTFTELKTYAITASKQELLAKETEREVDKKNIQLFMKPKVGQIFKAYIVQVLANKIIIELEDMPIRGVVWMNDFYKDDYYLYDEMYMRLVGERTGALYQLGSELELRLSKVDDDIYFSTIKK